MRDDSTCCKKEEADTSPSTPDMQFSDDFSQDELFQSSIGDDAIEQSDDDIEKISTENEEEQSQNQVTLETNAESQESNESLILKCQNVIRRMLKEEGKKDLGQCDQESCEKLINALKLILPNGLTLVRGESLVRGERYWTLVSNDLNYFKFSPSRSKDDYLKDDYLKLVKGFISWILQKPLNKKTKEADISPSTPDMHFPDNFSQDELFQSSIGDDTIEQSDDNIEKISTKNEEEESRNQVTLETNAENQGNNESLISKCQNVIFRMLKEDLKNLNLCGTKSCEKLINALKLILPNGLTLIKRKRKRSCTLTSIDLNYSKKFHSKSGNYYLKAVRGFISWLMLKPLNKKTKEADISPSTPDMHFSDEFSQDELFQSSIGDDAIEQSNDDIEKISTENEEKQSQNQVTLETTAESQESNESLILKCQNVIFRTLKEDGKKDLGQCDQESCEKLINALKLILPNGLTLIKKKRCYTLESIDLNYSKKSCSKRRDNYLKALRGFLYWLLRNPSDEETNLQTSQNDIINSQVLKCYEVISKIIIAKFGEDYFFFMEGNIPRLIPHRKTPSINEFKELIFKLNNTFPTNRTI